MDLLSGAAVNIVEYVLYLNLTVFQSLFQFLCIDNHPSQREQRADGRLAVMDRAEAIPQKRANCILSARDHVDNWDPGCAADVRLGILVDDFLRRHMKLPGNVKDIPRGEQDRVLMLAAFATFPALESEFTV